MFKRSLWLLALCLALLAPPAARAQLSFTLDPLSLSGSPGSLLTFSGTLANTGASPLFLTGDSFTLAGTGLSLDDTLFIEGAPLSLSGGESFAGPLFAVWIAPAVPNGSYQGSFTVLGGPSDSAHGDLATQSFSVEVVPEPATGVLLAAGLLAAGALPRRRRGCQGATDRG